MEKQKISSKISLSSLRNSISLAVAVKFSAIAAAVIVFYLQDLGFIFNNALSDESSTHLLIIPFMFLYILYRKRKVLLASVNQTHREGLGNIFDTAIGALLCATSVLIYWYGSYTFTPIEYHMFTLPIFTTGLTLLFFNRHTLRHLVVPILFLFFLTPPPTEILYGAGSALSVVSAIVANGVTNLVGIATNFSASQYGSPLISMVTPSGESLTFSVDIACSGIYSLIGFVVFSAFIAYIIRESPTRKLVTLLMGIPLIVALNIFRITALLIIGYNFGDEVALQVFHTVGGTVLMFIGTIILFGITEKIFKKRAIPAGCLTCEQTPVTPPHGFCDNCGKLLSYPKEKLKKVDLVKIISVIFIVIVLVSIQSPVFALTNVGAELTVQTPSGEQGNSEILPQIEGYTLNFLKRDTAFEATAGQDASLIYVYTPINPGNGSNPQIWVTIEVATAVSSLHRWETCLVNYPISQGYKPSVTQLDLRDVQINDNPPVLARYFSFQDNTDDLTQVVLYWYQTGTFSQNGTSISQNVKISLILYPSSPALVQAAEDALLPVAVTVNSYWEPIKSWATFSIIISQNGLTLSIVCLALLVALIAYKLLFIDRAQRELLKNLYGKIPEKDRFLLQIINKTKGNFTLATLSEELQKSAGTPVPEDWLKQELEQAEQAGFIEKIIVNKNDVPIIKWRINLKLTT
ncbi:MAG: exosortase/archaeosortase family protein [Candidatus Bathyarchaeota archaeon]|nr:exosortase/archaeosortase family protein [Candidatus Bathyarchaeota archaeon]